MRLASGRHATFEHSHSFSDASQGQKYQDVAREAIQELRELSQLAFTRVVHLLHGHVGDEPESQWDTGARTRPPSAARGSEKRQSAECLLAELSACWGPGRRCPVRRGVRGL